MKQYKKCKLVERGKRLRLGTRQGRVQAGLGPDQTRSGRPRAGHGSKNGNTTRQASGKETIPPRGVPTYEELEPAYRYGLGARSNLRAPNILNGMMNWKCSLKGNGKKLPRPED